MRTAAAVPVAADQPQAITANDPPKPRPKKLTKVATRHNEPVEAKASPAQSAKPGINGASKKTSNDVRLRAKPDNSAIVVAVIPSGERVKVVSCQAWCEIVYAGKRGFVYKGFLNP